MVAGMAKSLHLEAQAGYREGTLVIHSLLKSQSLPPPPRDTIPPTKPHL